MFDDESTQTSQPTAGTTESDEAATTDQSAPKKAPARKTAKKAAAKKATARRTPAKKAAAKKTAKNATAGTDAAGQAADETTAAETTAAKPTAADTTAADTTAADTTGAETGAGGAGTTADEPPAKKTTRRTTKKSAKKAAAKQDTAEPDGSSSEQTADPGAAATAAPPAAALLFQPPDPDKATPRKRTAKKPTSTPSEAPAEAPAGEAPVTGAEPTADDRQPERQAPSGADDDDTGEGGQRRRRRRGGRRRRKSDGSDGDAPAASERDTGDESDQPDTKKAAGSKKGSGDKGADDKGAGDKGAGDKGAGGKGTGDKASDEGSTGTRRRRRRRRQGEGDGDGASPDDPQNTVVRVREPRQNKDDEISGVTGSTRLEAKKQRRKEGREAGRRRAPIVSEAEFLARREAVDRVMAVRQRGEVTQIAVLEDDVLVEHYVARESQASMLGNVYLGRVQNVLPSMEAAFIDIGKGRNAVLYAGEVNWAALGKEGQPRRIETALKSGQPILVQVTKDPIGHKGARLTSQVSLPGRYLVYVPGGQTSGISRKLPDTERNRLKNLLKEILPEDAGVIIRTAAEGASEDELRRDVGRLTARWDDIESKVEGGQAPQMLYGEPDLMIKVVRDLFTEDFKRLVVSGDDAWDMIEGYVGHVAPDLMDRVHRWTEDADVFAGHRIDEQIEKGLERKVWLPSGGSLVIDRTEAMTVVDVNTGKFTGSGGNLEETVTKNNLEAAEEIVRQLRLRDIGGIIVVDFIDMVLESNRDLVLRRLIECLGRDRTRHQVAEVTSLGLVQMTRKRIGTGLLEAFSEPCESCGGRGLHTHHEPVEPKKTKQDFDDSRRGGGRRSRRGDDGGTQGQGEKQSAKADEKRSDKEGKSEKKDAAKMDGGKGQRDGGKGQRDGGKGQRDGGRDERVESAEPTEPPAAPAAETAPEPAPTSAASAAPAVPETPAPGTDHAGTDHAGTEHAGTDHAGTDHAGTEHTAPTRRTRRRAASRPAGPPQQSEAADAGAR